MARATELDMGDGTGKSDTTDGSPFGGKGNPFGRKGRKGKRKGRKGRKGASRY